MLIFQILIIAFAFFALTKAIGKFRDGILPSLWLIFWLVFWFVAVVVALLPETSTIAAQLVGIGRGADLVIYVSLIILFYLFFRLFTKIENLEKEITRLVRKLSLDEFDEEI